MSARRSRWPAAVSAAVLGLATAARCTAGPPAVADTNAPAFPLKLSADRRCLVDSKGTPFLAIGDSPWSLIAEPTAAQVDKYLDDRKAKGFTVLLVNLIEHKFSSRPPRLRDGTPPFTTPGDNGTGDNN